MPSILIVDDSKDVLEVLKLVFQPLGYTLKFASSSEEAEKLYEGDDFNIILAEVDTKPVSGIELLRKFRELNPEIYFILMTASSKIEPAILELKAGVNYYVRKPLKPDELKAAVNRGLEYNKASSADFSGVDSDSSMEQCFAVVGNSDKIDKVRQQIEKLSRSKASLLIEGPSGTGKAMIAKLLHEIGPVREGNFVELDCKIANPANLSNLLIGNDGQGGTLFKEATGGTLYLQNIDALPLDLQNSLSLVFRNFGNKVRLICASDVDLEEKVDEGEFSVDLFYRIALSVLTLPGLNDHIEDMGKLISFILDNAQKFNLDTHQATFSEEAIDKLKERTWNRNLEELVHVVTNAIINADGPVIKEDDL